MSHTFKGYDWTELAQCWGITLHKNDIIEVEHVVNGKRVVFQVDEAEEVLAEKIKQHIRYNIDKSTGEFIDPRMRDDLEEFLRALIEETDKHQFDTPVYRGILEIEDDYTFARWITKNLESLWT